MKLRMWMGLGVVICFAACAPQSNPEADWEGTYIGYVHRNQQDTTLVTLTFNGNYFAGASHKQKKVQGHYTSLNASQLNFDAQRHQLSDTGFSLNGTYQFEKAPDGSIRIWQEYGNVLEEFIVRELTQ